MHLWSFIMIIVKGNRVVPRPSHIRKVLFVLYKYRWCKNIFYVSKFIYLYIKCDKQLDNESKLYIQNTGTSQHWKFLPIIHLAIVIGLSFLLHNCIVQLGSVQ